MSEELENFDDRDTRNRRFSRNSKKRNNFKETQKRNLQIRKRKEELEDEVEELEPTSFQKPEKLKKYSNGKPERKSKSPTYQTIKSEEKKDAKSIPKRKEKYVMFG